MSDNQASIYTDEYRRLVERGMEIQSSAMARDLYVQWLELSRGFDSHIEQLPSPKPKPKEVQPVPLAELIADLHKSGAERIELWMGPAETPAPPQPEPQEPAASPASIPWSPGTITMPMSYGTLTSASGWAPSTSSSSFASASGWGGSASASGIAASTFPTIFDY